MESLLKLCKIPKFYEQGWLKIFYMLFISLKMIEICEQNVILAQVRTGYQKLKAFHN